MVRLIPVKADTRYLLTHLNQLQFTYWNYFIKTDLTKHYLTTIKLKQKQTTKNKPISVHHISKGFYSFYEDVILIDEKSFNDHATIELNVWEIIELKLHSENCNVHDHSPIAKMQFSANANKELGTNEMRNESFKKLYPEDFPVYIFFPSPVKYFHADHRNILSILYITTSTAGSHVTCNGSLGSIEINKHLGIYDRFLINDLSCNSPLNMLTDTNESYKHQHHNMFNAPYLVSWEEARNDCKRQNLTLPSFSSKKQVLDFVRRFLSKCEFDVEDPCIELPMLFYRPIGMYIALTVKV